MPNETQQKGDTANHENKDKPKWWSWKWWITPLIWLSIDFRWLIPAIAIGIGILLDVSWYHIRASQNTQFFVTGLLAFGTLLVVTVQAVIYRHQWKAMRETLQELRISRETENAAFIGIKIARLDNPPIRAGVAPTIVVTIINTGKTVAINYQVSAHDHAISSVGLIDFIPTFAGDVTRESPRIMTPGVDCTYGFRIPEVTQEDVGLINSAQKYIIVWAKLEYEDIFGNPHWTTFCLLYNVLNKAFNPCGHGNECDYQYKNDQRKQKAN